jgi:hypothetical protein
LLVERSVGFVIGVGEGVPHRLEVVPAALEEPKTQVGGMKLRPASVAAGSQGLRAPEFEPLPKVGQTFEEGKHHLLGVARPLAVEQGDLDTLPAVGIQRLNEKLGMNGTQQPPPPSCAPFPITRTI